MEYIKEAFNKVKYDMDLLRNEINSLKLNLSETREMMIEICEIIDKIDKKIKKNSFQTQDNFPTNRQKNPTKEFDTSTHNTNFRPLNAQNLPFSIGNEGVPTDKQTNRQTDKSSEIYRKSNEEPLKEAFDIIDSLDSIKKEIRLKFKRLTNQEFLVFSTLYHLEEERGHSDYKILSQKLGLSESSIRDYIGRLITKGIPIVKNKINNKNITLSVPKNFKKIASLQTILQLRGI